MVRVEIVKDRETGVAVLESYWFNDVLHRDSTQGAAFTWRDVRGRLRQMSFIENGVFHRLNGPAQIFSVYGRQGELALHYRWNLNGFPHRDPRIGPAHVSYAFPNEDGRAKLVEERYYWHGYKYRDPSAGPHFTSDVSGPGHEKKFATAFTPRRKFLGPCPSAEEMGNLYKRRAPQAVMRGINPPYDFV